MMVGSFQYKSIEAFHKHLDISKRCRDRTFDLCTEGGSLLEACVTGAPALTVFSQTSEDFSKERR